MSVDPAISTPPESAGRKFYLAYLNSSSWRITRNRALALAGHQCERCQTKRDLQVHHKTYERLGREWDQDLEVLCDNCHGSHHELEKAQQGINPRIYLKIVGEVMHGLSVQTFSDLAEAVKTACARLRIPYDSQQIGHAIALVAGKQKADAPVGNHAPLVVSHEPLNKGEALRIMFELMKDDRGRGSIIRTIPSAGLSSEEVQSREAQLRRQIADEQREQYRRDSRRLSFVERLEQIFSEPV